MFRSSIFEADSNDLTGEVTLTTGDAEYPLESAYINEESKSVRYFRYDFPEDVNGWLDGIVGIVANGDETPAFEQGVVEARMPDELTLFRPAQDDVVRKGPMPVEWSAGADSDTISIIMTVFKKTNEGGGAYQMEDIHEIRCTVVDDGEFEIPAAIMDQLPADYTADLSLSRRHTELRTVSPEFTVRLDVFQEVQIEMQVPSTLIP